jgi:hypothetical protein
LYPFAAHQCLFLLGRGDLLGPVQRLRGALPESRHRFEVLALAGDQVAVELDVDLAQADLQFLCRAHARHMTVEHHRHAALGVADVPRRPQRDDDQRRADRDHRSRQPRHDAALHCASRS